MQTVTNTFSDAGVSPDLLVRKGEKFSYAVDYSADFDGGLFLERTRDGGITYDTVREFAVGYKTDVTTTIVEEAEGLYRFRCILDPEADPAALTGTAAVTLTGLSETVKEFKNAEGKTILAIKEDGVAVTGDVAADTATVSGNVTPGGVVRPSQVLIISAAGHAKVGATAGAVVAAADNKALVTVPASQTASTIVVPIPALKVGQTITAFSLIGQIESAGNHVTVDADLRKMTAAAADVSDASVGAITQLDVVADTIMSASNTAKASLTEVVAADETFYVLITITTAASTDVALQGVRLVVTEA